MFEHLTFRNCLIFGTISFFKDAVCPQSDRERRHCVHCLAGFGVFVRVTYLECTDVYNTFVVEDTYNVRFDLPSGHPYIVLVGRFYL